MEILQDGRERERCDEKIWSRSPREQHCSSSAVRAPFHGAGPGVLRRGQGQLERAELERITETQRPEAEGSPAASASHATYVRTGSSAPVARAPSVRPSVRPHPCPCNDPPRLLAQQVGAARSRREKRESQPNNVGGWELCHLFTPRPGARGWWMPGWIDRSSANVAASSCPDRRRGADRRTDSRHGGCLTECLAGKWERGCRLV